MAIGAFELPSRLADPYAPGAEAGAHGWLGSLWVESLEF